MFDRYRYKRGAKPSLPDDRDYSLCVPKAATYPAKFIPTGPTIGKQAVSNCVAWAAAYAFEIAKKKIFSKGYLYGDRADMVYQGEGIHPRDLLKTALNYGNVLYKTYPYEYEVTKAQRQVKANQAALRAAAAPYKIKAYARLANANEVKAALMNGMGIIFSAPCSQLKAGTHGIFPMNFPTYGSHCMAIIGWDDNYHGGSYAYCPQSWGTSWGLNGYCYVPWTDVFRNWDVWAIDFANDPVKPADPTKPHVRRTLRKGMKGDDVKELQSKLMSLGYDLGKWGADGDFGSATQAAVRAFQKANRLENDSIAGPLTFAALGW